MNEKKEAKNFSGKNYLPKEIPKIQIKGFFFAPS